MEKKFFKRGVELALSSSKDYKKKDNWTYMYIIKIILLLLKFIGLIFVASMSMCPYWNLLTNTRYCITNKE